MLQLHITKSKDAVRESPGDAVYGSSDLIQTLKFMEDFDREHFYVLHLNTRNRVIGRELVSVGTLTGSLIHAREVFKGAILNNSFAIVCVHNHPSGDPTPSGDDFTVTRQLIEWGKLLSIPVYDHLIIGRGCYESIVARMAAPVMAKTRTTRRAQA